MATPTIDVRAQTPLGLARTFQLCLKGIRHRMFRSLLTTAVVVLAVAFFMNLLTDSALARAVGQGVAAETTAARRAIAAADLWFGRPGAAVVAGRLVAADTAGRAAYAGLLGWRPDRVDALAAACAAERRFLDWLGDLDSGTRAIVVRRVRSDAVLAWLAEPARWKAFVDGVGQLRSHRPPLPLERIRVVVASAPATRAELDAAVADWHAAVTRLEAAAAADLGATGREAVLDAIAAADPVRLAAFGDSLATCGFAGLMPPSQLPAIQSEVRAERLRERVIAALGDEAGRRGWRQAFHTTPPLEERLLQLSDPRAERALEGRFTAAELVQVERMARRDRTLADREVALAGKVDPGGALLSQRQLFLVGISFVVCMVGIANAMLMAITERFREIATQKCLGATDGFILTQFLMEAGIQGAFGGFVGMVLGLALAVAKGAILYGGHLGSCFPVLAVVGCGVICVAAGLVLATLASVYPSLKAARMAPMEAMRVE